ncbi:MarR family winged helix-turn-helix transcriptional regulator [Cupriavidus consociatus]|uniref:MarR family winged helix-turn-helix transcriptional regulator n=1 Tax=Cupriavidus consociatus TaxID=2821357 RepID=UPI001AE6A87E|nr:MULTISPECIES: MarR family transcriptional regulator [unclassified Cupriavidus]MBP0619592.1 MarR family transcriptional regulator [Cupriavidus sp. LEh25]
MPHAANTPTGSILEYLTFRLNRLCEMTKDSASGFYEREFGIGLRELRVLRFAGLEPGLTLTRLIELVLLEKTVTSKLVTALAKRGLLRREVGAADARQLNLFLTQAGAALVAQTYQRGDVLEKMFLSILTEAEVQTLDRCIGKLTTALEAHQRGIGPPAG